MPLRRAARLCLLSLTCLLPAAAPRASQRCQPPPIPAPREPIIFTPRQEMDLGDIVAERIQKDFRVIDDDEIAGRLRRIGERLVAQLPPSEMRYQFFLIDLPEVNAFALPGGRVYLTRKLVAFVRSEDELAGVVAHELGHIVARQQAADLTRLFREVLGVTSVGDRRDIYEKYHLYVENAARRPGAHRGGSHEAKEQTEADLIGLTAVAAAGYDPQAVATAFDRMAETKGKTGNWLSNVFGATPPEARRLREILKGLAALPAECRGPSASAPDEEFLKWQAAVVAYAGGARREALHGVLSKTRLEPPLRGDVTHLQFSPDGRYVLAQDDSGINVLTREPFKPLFRVEAPEALPAQFTPDSAAVVFNSPGLRVETWSVADGRQTSARELYVRNGCAQTELSPDGRALGCFETDLTLSLYDVETGAPLVQKKEFIRPYLNQFVLLALLSGAVGIDVEIDWVRMRFSPDGRYFAAGKYEIGHNALGVYSGYSTLAYDLRAKAAVQPKGNLKKLLGGKFAFMGADRVVGVHAEDVKKSGVYTFPGGEPVEEFPLFGAPDAATEGPYLMLRPFREHAVAVFDLTDKKLLMANKQPAFDIYGEHFVAERVNGELGLYRTKTRELVAHVALPRGDLGRLRAAAVSPDLKWLAASERSRGAVWDLSKGERVFHVRGFRGAHFTEDGALYADFPKFDQAERSIARLDLSTRGATEQVRLGGGDWVRHFGPVLVTYRPAKEGGGLRENVTVEVGDAGTGKALWTRAFQKEAPWVVVDEQEGAVVFGWPVRSEAARAEVRGDAALSKRLAALREKEGDYFMQVFDARTGKALGALLVETGKGSFHIHDVYVAGDRVVFEDSENRVLVYSLATGEALGRVFGARPSVSRAGNLLSVENERGRLTLYDLATAERRDEYTFASPVALTRFSADGRRLLVLTADQTAYTLDLTQPAPARKEK